MKKIEKIIMQNIYYPQITVNEILATKINEIIDYINSQNNISDNVEDEKESDE